MQLLPAASLPLVCVTHALVSDLWFDAGRCGTSYGHIYEVESRLTKFLYC